MPSPPRTRLAATFAIAVIAVSTGPQASGSRVQARDAVPRRDQQCGSFELPGVLKPVRVKITRGEFPCRIAMRVMDDLYHGRDVGHWQCIGPQTGYAKCTKPNRGTVVGRI